MPLPNASLSVAALAITLLATPAAAQDWKQTLADHIRFGLRSPADTGTQRSAPIVLEVRADGLPLRIVNYTPVITTTFINGVIQQPGRLSLHRFKDDTDRRLKTGERLILDDVNIEDDQVKLFVVGESTYPIKVEREETDSRGKKSLVTQWVQQRYRGAIAFGYSPDRLRTTTWDSISTAVLAVVRPALPKDAVPKIALGQTREQVEAILGKPDKIVDLGTKVIYVYKDLKVQFVDGKVTDVQ